VGRLTEVTSELHQVGKKALVAYVVAGDPHPKVTVPLMHQMVAAGVDIIELGVPFTDPEAEGPVIQAAHERALAHQVTLQQVIDMVIEFRTENTGTPVVLMGYLNPIERMGYQAFSQSAGKAGVDGLITVNLPPEEAGDLAINLKDNGVDAIYLVAPTTTESRARRICEASQGFVYYVSLKGTTGAGSLDIHAVQARVTTLKDYTDLPLLVGFGIKDGESAGLIASVADGVVVGSAIVSLFEKGASTDGASPESQVTALIAEIRSALDAQIA